MAPLRKVLRLRRTDQTAEHLLVNVSQTNATRPLDLKLVATEQEHLYHATIRNSEIDKLQSAQFDGDHDRWQDVLCYIFLHIQPDGSDPDAFAGLETVAALGDSKTTITIRQNIGGITRKLGSVDLVQDDEREEVAAFEWVDVAVGESDDLRAELADTQAALVEQQKLVAGLTSQLDELIQAKKEHDQQLLEKFAALLNTKKLKIRDQQRLLNGARIDSRMVADDIDSEVHKVAASRHGKRKANGASSGDARRAEQHDLFEGDAADVDDLGVQEVTDQASDETATATDSSDGEGFAATSTIRSRGDVAKGSASQTSREKEKSDMIVDQVAELPPRRALPFAHKPSQTTKQPSPRRINVDEDDDDETDDEL